MKQFIGIAATFFLTACAGGPGITHSVTTLPLLNDTTIGGPDYPVVISGAEQTGLTEEQIAKNLRFPARLRADSSFKAVKEDGYLVDHAHLYIGPDGTSTLAFLHGNRAIGTGDFSLPLVAYADPQALGSTSSVLISEMLKASEDDKRGNERRRRSYF